MADQQAILQKEIDEKTAMIDLMKSKTKEFVQKLKSDHLIAIEQSQKDLKKAKEEHAADVELFKSQLSELRVSNI